MLDRLSSYSDASIGQAKGVLRLIQRTRASAADGNLRDLNRHLESLEELLRELVDGIDRLRQAYDIDPRGYLESGAYGAELRIAADKCGLAMLEDRDYLACHPSIVRIIPECMAIEIDRQRQYQLRPSKVSSVLAARQHRPPRFKPDSFLNSLARAYDLTAARSGRASGSVIRLADIWSTFTLLPGQEQDYTKEEFARDLYDLDRSGCTVTRSALRLRWYGSSGTRATGVLTVIALDGRQRQYWGVRFAPANERGETGDDGHFSAEA